MAGDEGATDDVGGGDGSGAVSWGLRVKLLEGSRGGNAVSVVKGGPPSSLTDSMTRRLCFLTADDGLEDESFMSRRGEWFVLTWGVSIDTLTCEGLLSSFATSTGVAVRVFAVEEWIARFLQLHRLYECLPRHISAVFALSPPASRQSLHVLCLVGPVPSADRISAAKDVSDGRLRVADIRANPRNDQLRHLCNLMGWTHQIARMTSMSPQKCSCQSFPDRGEP